MTQVWPLLKYLLLFLPWSGLCGVWFLSTMRTSVRPWEITMAPYTFFNWYTQALGLSNETPKPGACWSVRYKKHSFYSVRHGTTCDWLFTIRVFAELHFHVRKWKMASKWRHWQIVNFVWWYSSLILVYSIKLVCRSLGAITDVINS